MVREWRHLKMAKRSGRAHDPGGIEAMSSGGFAILCRACPLPTINLPADWKWAPPARAWLYASKDSLDANFRLKNQLRSSDEKDPALGPGFTYFVKAEDYAHHLRNYVDQEEVHLNVVHLFHSLILQTRSATVSALRHYGKPI